MIFDLHHLKKSNLSYFQHAIRVIVISVKLLLLSIVGIIHAIFPVVFLKTVSNGIKKLYAQISNI